MLSKLYCITTTRAACSPTAWSRGDAAVAVVNNAAHLKC